MGAKWFSVEKSKRLNDKRTKRDKTFDRRRGFEVPPSAPRSLSYSCTSVKSIAQPKNMSSKILLKFHFLFEFVNKWLKTREFEGNPLGQGL